MRRRISSSCFLGEEVNPKDIIGSWMLAEGFLTLWDKEKKNKVSRIGWISWLDKDKCIIDDGKYQTTLYHYELIRREK